MDVKLTDEAAEQYKKLPLSIKHRVDTLFGRLEKWPDVSGAKPLRGALAGSYRLRTGDYRVQFHVAGGRVIVDKLGYRDGFYED